MTIPSTPFSDHELKIFESEYTHAWFALSELATINSWLDCGEYLFTWKQQKEGESIETLDTAIFAIDETAMTIKV